MFLHNRDRYGKNSRKCSSNKDGGLFTSRNIVIYVFILALPICTSGIFRLVIPGLNSYQSANFETSFHPTSIPWIDNSRKCEDTGRIWATDKCWDTEHSPQF